MKKITKAVQASNPALKQDYPSRLTELEKELRRYPALAASERALGAVKSPEAAAIGVDQVVQFQLHKKPYAAGHTDIIFSGSNHTRGVRHVRFYDAGKIVLDIEGDYENQEFGSNFRFQNIDVYVPGEWEADFMKLTTELIEHKTARSNAFKAKRAEHARKNKH